MTSPRDLDLTDQVVSREEFCRLLGVSRWTFRRWERDDLVPRPLVLPGRARWARRDVLDFVRFGRRMRRARAA